MSWMHRPFGPVASRRVAPDQCALADPAQDVVGEHAARQHQGVGGELARGQALDVEVGLELAVELLRGAMIVVEFDAARWERGEEKERSVYRPRNCRPRNCVP